MENRNKYRDFGIFSFIDKMPTQKRKLAQLQNEKKKVAKTNHAITAFLMNKETSRTDEVDQTESDHDPDPDPPVTQTTQSAKKRNNSGHKVGIILDTMTNNIRERFTDTDTIDQLAVLDLTGTDHLETMYGYTEIEALAQKFDINTEDLLLQWQDFIELINTRDQQNRSLLDIQKLFSSSDHKDLNLQQMYPLIYRLYTIATVQPLSTAEVERVFSQVKLIKTSHRSNLKTSTLTQILTVKLNCNQDLFNTILDDCVKRFFAKKERRLVSIV